jgi:hypothetical protein
MLFTAESAEATFAIPTGHAKPCAVCGTPTKYVDVCTEAHICGPDCSTKMYEEFNEWANAPAE